MFKIANDVVRRVRGVPGAIERLHHTVVHPFDPLQRTSRENQREIFRAAHVIPFVHAKVSEKSGVVFGMNVTLDAPDDAHQRNVFRPYSDEILFVNTLYQLDHCDVTRSVFKNESR